MRVSLQWLKELVAAPPESFGVASLAERLSIAGFEVDGIEDLAAQAAGVVVGFVTEREPHPNADKLSVCQVDVGAAQCLQIVCGAANVRAGIHVPVALVGATLPAVNLTIKAAELRGVASTGMICSLTELGLPSPVDGIAILDELQESLPPLGSPVGPLLGLDDQVLELAITANRPDGLSMAGIAREVAAIVGGRTTLPASAVAVPTTPLPTDDGSRERMQQGGIFSVTELVQVQVAPSPPWLQQRLEKAGVRPINNVVDITNLVMLETGQPLHAFDRGRLAESGDAAPEPGRLGLRQGRDAESFTSLDGVQRSLSSESLLVTYDDAPIALAGVMGGSAEAVSEATDAIWLEAAVFPAMAVRRSSRSVGLRTEASSRFEKGLPPEATLAASDRAVVLLQELCGAEVTSRWLVQRPERATEGVTLRRHALHNLLGPVLVEGEAQDLADERIVATLEALGCEVVDREEGWQVSVPPSRAIDLQREVDLIEEVARLVGYDHFASHLPDPIRPGGLEPEQIAERRLRRALAAAGLQETCSFSLVPAAEGRIGLANPLLEDYGHLRDGLLEELLAAARRNLQSGAAGFWAFEIGHVFPVGEGGASRQQLGGVICGERRAERWSSSGKARPLSYFQARGVLQQAVSGLAIPTEDRQRTDLPQLHPGRCAEILVEGRPAGWFGQLHPEHAEAQDLPSDTHVFQLELGALLTAATRRNRWQPPFSPYATVPAAERDLALVVPEATQAGLLLSLIRKAGRPLLEHAELIDRYSGEQVASGRCSQAFRLRYRDPRRTLTDSEVDEAHGRILAAVEQQPGVQLRG